jgi:hypothetical protein
MTEDHNSLLYWYPKIQYKVPTPKTVIIPVTFDVGASMDQGFPKEFEIQLKTEAMKLGYPIFMRTETLAAKHQWERSCYVPREEDILQHLFEIFEMQLMLDLSGVGSPKAVVLREFLHLRTFFTTHRGMPVAREFRCFGSRGQIECYHPYWPHAALEEGRPSNDNWRALLPQLEKKPPMSALEIARVASENFDEQMSIDICELEDGRWFVTDMATGRESLHWKHGSDDGGTRQEHEGKLPPIEPTVEEK